MSKKINYLPLAAIAAGVAVLAKKNSSEATSGIGATKELVAAGRMIYLKYKSTSYYGNPKYSVEVATEDGDILRGETATNASLGYSIRNYGYADGYGVVKNGDLVNWYYHYTPSRKLVFDYVRPLGR